MEYVHPEALVTTDWLAEHLNDPEIRVVDATWFMLPSMGDAVAEFEREHIPGAVRFDIDDISDKSNPLPHMLPDAVKFSSKVQGLGLGDGSKIVVYDRSGPGPATRVWWMFRAFGHDNVCLLNGGFAKWKVENRSTEAGAAHPKAKHFHTKFKPDLVKSKEQVLANIKSKRSQFVDARAADRFAGAAPEPRPSKQVGHVPGSRNIPWNDLVDAGSKEFLPADKITQRFKDAGLDLEKPLISSCGSGVTACVVAFGAYLMGHDKVAIYDGSWSEWGNADDVPVVQGPAT